MMIRDVFSRQGLKRILKPIPLPRVVKKHPFFVVFYACLLLFVGLLFFIFILAQKLPSIAEIENRQIPQSTKILDRTGKIVLYELSGDQRRTVVPLEEMPRYLKDATIAIEDKRFYEEPGVSVRGIMRAFYINLTHADVVQGGSTITQQLARNAFLTTEQTAIRKIKELILAVRLDRHYTKNQILELYLNEIPYGPTAYGAETASQTYFGKPVRELSLAESAVLAALPKAPSYYSPWGSHEKELLARQGLILRAMLKQGRITQEEYDSAIDYKIEFQPQGGNIKAPHFVFAVQDYLAKKYGEEMIRVGGLRVITTLDMDMQKVAEKAVLEGAERNERLYEGKNAALVAEDPKTGQILALVGSRDFFDRENEGNFNVATQGLRQPGSSLKPFVYLAAFEKGFSPDSVVFDVPTEFVSNNPSCPEIPNFYQASTKCFHPENFDNSFAGPVSFRKALTHSLNIPSVKVLYLTGLSDTLKTLADFGITTLTDPRRYGLSLVLGGGEVKLSELVGAYSTLASEGMLRERAIILEIQNSSGIVLEQFEEKGKRVVDSQYPRLINDILSDVDARAGLFGASLNLTTFPGREIALKTGTTNNYRDAWTIGYTPSLVVGVWAGNNNNEPMQKKGSSLLAAVPIWNAFMKEVIDDLPVETFTRPAPVSPEKPILRGDYLWNHQVHSILYYVSKNDPSGPSPLNPEDDPQFHNWETSVLAWAANNIPDFSLYNTVNGYVGIASSTAPGWFSIRMISPLPGSFVDQYGIDIQGQIGAAEEVVNIRIYMNNTLIQELPGLYPAGYQFATHIAPQTLLLQNMIEVEAISMSGKATRSNVIVYKKE